MKKIKLLLSLGSISTLGGGVLISTTSCSKNEEEKKEEEIAVETNNYVNTSNGKYYLADDLDPNILCGENKTISFVSPSVSGKGINREFNKKDIKNITIKSINSNTTKINDYFLNGFTNVTSIDLSWLSTINDIGKQFMCNCNKLTLVNLGTIDITKLSFDDQSFSTTDKDAICYKEGVKLVYSNDRSDYDLWVWNNLIDHNSTTSPYRKIKASFNGMIFNNTKKILANSIDPNSFVTTNDDGQSWKTTTYNLKGGGSISVNYQDEAKWETANISEIVLGADTVASSINSYFLSYCKKLTSVDLSGLKSVIKINDGFLEHCDKLTNIDLSGLNHVTAIGNLFMFSCTGLLELDLSLLSSIETIGNSFLQSCTNLVTFKWIDSSPLKTIGTYFLAQCDNLVNISLRGLTSVETIDSHFLYLCTSLTYVNLSYLISLKENGIKGSCLYNAKNFTSIEIGTLEANRFEVNNTSFATDNKSDPIYTKGVLIYGDNAEGVFWRLDNSMEAPYRNLKY